MCLIPQERVVVLTFCQTQHRVRNVSGEPGLVVIYFTSIQQQVIVRIVEWA